MDTLTRLISKRVIDPITGCWNWTPEPKGDGYPYIWHRGKVRKASRVAFLIFRGIDLGEKFALHDCDNKRCFNPSHIHPGTNRQNLIEHVDRGHHYLRKRERCIRGHLFDEANTRIWIRADGRYMRTCKACKVAYDKEYRGRIK